MNEKVAKKMGEAYAFAHVFSELCTTSKTALSDLLGAHATEAVVATAKQKGDLSAIATANGVQDIVITKAEKTGAKITYMATYYVGDDWDDPAEVLEWLGFFLGAAIVHWQLIAGCAKELRDESFEKVALDGVNYYEQLLETARTRAEAIGRSRA